MLGKDVKRFDTSKKPKKQNPLLLPIIWSASLFTVLSGKTVIEKTGMEGIKPPYLLLCNHNAFRDFMVASAAIFPRRANFVVAIDGFIGREWLLRAVGCVCTRKFVSDIALVRQMKRIAEMKQIAVLYPEARYSLCGTSAVLPESLGKLAKLMNVPVVTLNVHGHHISSPFWNLKKRKIKGVKAEMKCLLRTDELNALSVPEINEKIREALTYDDFAWQLSENKIINEPFRAEKLHKVLYQCPACGTKYRMNSKGDELFCEACGKRWRMDELGRLSAESGETEFSHIPDWYEWERSRVRQEAEAGKYRFESDVRIDWLPNAKRFIDLGRGHLIHDGNGFHLRGVCEGEPFETEFTVPSIYSCHIEYEYLGVHGDCIDLNTRTDTFYIYPEGDFSVTEIALATEELYSLRRAENAGRNGKCQEAETVN